MLGTISTIKLCDMTALLSFRGKFQTLEVSRATLVILGTRDSLLHRSASHGGGYTSRGVYQSRTIQVAPVCIVKLQITSNTGRMIHGRQILTARSCG